MKKKKVVCLGGGIGTVNLIKGLRSFDFDITVVVSMADEGGSSGRLRRLYNILPPGDLVSCMAALASSSSPFLSKFLTYRFPGDRYGKDEELSGQKLGNLCMVALCDITGSFEKAIKVFQKIFDIPGTFLPATDDHVSISAKTIEGQEIFGEEKIDLGKYNGKRVLSELFLHPKDVKAGKEVIKSLKEADVIIAGPGDLYTTILPVLMVSEISHALQKSRASKLFVINVANKPFETKGYSVSDYIQAVTKHIGCFPFQTVILNNNFSLKIPKTYHYAYVKNGAGKSKTIQFIKKDLIDRNFPLYHDSKKLAKAVSEAL